MGIFPSYDEVMNKKKTPAVKGASTSKSLFPAFDEVIKPPAPVMIGSVDVSQHAGNVHNPVQIQEFPKINPLKEAFKPSSLFNATKKIFSGTTQTVNDIKETAVNLKNTKDSDIWNAPGKFASAAWDSVKDAVGNEAINVIELVTGKRDQTGERLNNSEAVSTGIKTITGLGNIAFSPITALFKGADEVPGLNIISKTISLPFAAAGDLGTGAAKEFVKKLPISQESKDEIGPAVEEMYALAAQLVLGSVTHSTYKKIKEKFKPAEADIIIEKGTEMAETKKSLELETKATESFVPEAKEFPKSDPFKASLPEDFVTKPVEGFPKVNPLPEIPRTVEGSGKYPTIHEGGKIKMVDGDPVKIIDGVETFLHKGDGGWIVSEASTGRAIAESRSTEGVIAKANMILSDIPKNELLKTLEEKKLNIPKSEVVTPKVENPTGTSKVATSIETKSVEKGLTEGFGELAGYDKITIKDQAQRAADLMSKDIEMAKQMVRGEIPMEKGLRAEMLIKAMEDFAQAKGDVKLSMDIAKSPLVSETSAHAQAMRILAERNPDSVVAKLREVKQAREASAVKKAGKNKTIDKVKNEEVKKIQAEIKKKAPTKQAWADFVESIKC